MNTNLTDREFATVLAALRCFQQTHAPATPGDAVEDADGCDHFYEHSPLTATEIDELCERINTTDEPPCTCSLDLRTALAFADHRIANPDCACEQCVEHRADAKRCRQRTDGGPCTPFHVNGKTCEYCDRPIR